MVGHRIGSRLQQIHRIVHRLAELVCPVPIRSPLKQIADVSAKYSEVHAILFVGHLVLTTFEPGTSRSQMGMKLTLIVVRRIVATPKTAGAGTRRFLSDVHQTDNNTEREDGAIAFRLLLGFVCHTRNAR